MSDNSEYDSTFPVGIAQKALRARYDAQLLYLLENLNPEQEKAVKTTEGPLLVLAGAGTGKTRVLTTRIAYILTSGKAYPDQILAVTFTNKAAEEMKKRINSVTESSVQKMPWMGTFHAIGLKITRRHAETIGLKSDFSILDTDDQIRLIKHVIQDHGLDEKRWPARIFAKMIDTWKNKGLEPKNVPESDTKTFANGKARELYHLYQDRLKSLNACDFGDLLLHPVKILREHNDILKYYQKKFRYILVDEYQDTNTTQYMFLRLLTQRSHSENQAYKEPINICCVGDDDQAIYGWRGAQISNILRFERDFQSAHIIRLERNYRSTQHILAAASHLIAHNKERIGKTLQTDKISEEDQRIRIHAARDSEEETYEICRVIDLYRNKTTKLNEMAILVRASFQMREFEDRFIIEGINYRVIGGPRFYERLEIRDALAFLRVVAYPYNDLAFERILNVPKRGLGEATLKRLHQIAKENAEPLFKAAQKLTKSDSASGSRKSLCTLVENFERWQNDLQIRPHAELSEMILEESGYMDMWKNDPSEKARERIENLKELIRSMENYESLHGFLDHVSLVMDTEGHNERDAVSLMTIHSAKGLEFETVFLPGWEEELFPHPRSLNENGQEGLEEERRLAYVALTRAKKNVHIWFVSSRRIHGLWQSARPSRFLEELPEKHIETEWPNIKKNNMPTSLSQIPEKYTTTLKIENKGAHTLEKKAPLFEIGERVFHLKFGNGNITNIDEEKLTVSFDKAGEKKIIDRFLTKT